MLDNNKKNFEIFLGIKNYFLPYSRGGNVTFITSLYNLNWRVDLDIRCSTIGFEFLLEKATIGLSNKRQPIMMLSIIKAKYMFASKTIHESIKLKCFFEKLGIP